MKTPWYYMGIRFTMLTVLGILSLAYIVVAGMSVQTGFTLLTMLVLLVIAYVLDKKSYLARYEHMRAHYIAIITSLAAAIDARDPSTLGHTERVMELTRKMGNELPKFGFNTDANFKESLQLAALLHDIGKIGIPEQILRKAGPPTEAEWEQIRKHPDIGAAILEPLKDTKGVKEAVLHHQEHYDGLGYPKGLKANTIPLISRIIMIIDAYDAITSDRSYRKGRSKQEAIEEIKANSGTQFDPKLVDIFVHMLEKTA